MESRTIIFHIDVNSAFLSWSAAYRTEVLGEKTDLRTAVSYTHLTLPTTAYV